MPKRRLKKLLNPITQTNDAPDIHTSIARDLSTIKTVEAKHGNQIQQQIAKDDLNSAPSPSFASNFIGIKEDLRDMKLLSLFQCACLIIAYDSQGSDQAGGAAIDALLVAMSAIPALYALYLGSSINNKSETAKPREFKPNPIITSISVCTALTSIIRSFMEADSLSLTTCIASISSFACARITLELREKTQDNPHDLKNDSPWRKWNVLGGVFVLSMIHIKKISNFFSTDSPSTSLDELASIAPAPFDKERAN